MILKERIKVSKNFYLDEFIDPITYYSELDRGVSKLDERIFDIAQKLRELKGSSITINNWWAAHLEYFKKNSTKTIEDFSKFYVKRGQFQYSGYRPQHYTKGAKLSAHRFGKAIDPKGNEKEYYDIFINNIEEFYRLGVRRIEDISITKGWFHIDTMERNVKVDKINVVGLKAIVKYLNIK